MKVLINRNCGIRLSAKAIQWLIERKSELIKSTHLDTWVYEDEHPDSAYAILYKDIIPNSTVLEEGSLYNLTWECIIKDQIIYQYHDYPAEKVRIHPDLIQCHEELGVEAEADRWSRRAEPEFKIIEIPDDVEFEIHETESGYEYIAEKHRTWGFNSDE